VAVLTPVIHATGKRIGTAVVAIRRLEMEQAIEASRRTQGVLLMGVLVVGTLAMLGLMLKLVSPATAIRGALERIGRGDLDGRLRPAGAAEFRMLSESLNDMAGRLRLAQREALERERLAGEMDIASRIQRSLLPSGRFVSGDFVMVGAHRPAAEVGGDYYDFLTRSDGRVALVVADVAGKGVGGALVTSMLASLLRAFCHTADAPSSLLILIEKHLGPYLERQTFITVWHGVLDPDSGRLVHAAAGHLPLLLVRAGATRGEWFRTRAVPLGIGGPAGLRDRLADADVVLAPGDVVVQVTDGVTEAARPGDGEQFGFERLEQVVVRNAPRGADAVVRAVDEAVSAWAGGAAQDDETVLVVARNAAASPDAGHSPASVHDLVELSQSQGHHLRLDAALADLARLRGWMLDHAELASLSDDHRQRIELALYELCANVIEHGYRRSSAGSLDLCWIPDSAADARAGAARAGAATPAPAPAGCFVIRDHGRPFDPGRGLAPDLRDPATRRHGRGLGLEMARRILTRLRYYPNTDYGNLTHLRFDPRRSTEDPQ
jgi:serine phosphatase RsbU (regulator of sigma subunit)/anti-sigma regulatory factor (Ser/Thr protein kinase)